MRKKMIKTLLQHGLIVNHEDVDNPSLLNTAVENGNLKIVEDLLKYRDDINMLVDDYSTGLTPLHSAVKEKQVQMAKLLLNYGANVNVIDSEGTSPIVNAIQNNDMEMTELLLTNGADIKKDPKALCTAVKKGSLKIVEDLLKYGGDINMLNNSTYGDLTPLHHAVKGKQVQMAKLLINYGSNVNVQDCHYETPIVHAIQNSDTEMIELLLNNGADIKKDPKVLCTAVKKGSLKIVEDLLKHGADVNMLNNSIYRDLTPLHHAVNGKQVQMVKLLIKYGVDVNVTDGYGRTPTAYAIQRRDTEMTKLLVTNGVDVKGNRNLLYFAVESGSLTIVEDLLKYGADVNARDQYGRTALHYTVLHLTMDNCKCGLKAFFNVCNDVRYQTRHNRRCMQKMVELLLSKGAYVNVETESGITTLFAASRKGYKDIVSILLKYGAECDPGAEEDIKPLHAATVRGHSKIVENLLKFGAKVDSRDKYGRTALHFAFRGRYEQIVRTLLGYGSDVNIISIKNQTPLEYGRLVVDFANRNEDDFVYYMHNYNDSRYYMNDSPSVKLLKQHIAKMKAAGLHISERNLLGISSDHGINNFLNKCEAEIEIMKSEKIDNSCVSFYDILTKNTSQLAKNKSIVQALKSNDYKTKLPIYASMIDSRFRRGVKREKLLEQVRKKFLYSLFGSLPELPLLCADKIFSYLSDKDLKILLVV